MSGTKLFCVLFLFCICLPIAFCACGVVLVGGCTTAVVTTTAMAVSEQMAEYRSTSNDWIDWELERRMAIDGDAESVCLVALLADEEVETRADLVDKLVAECAAETFELNRSREEK